MKLKFMQDDIINPKYVITGIKFKTDKAVQEYAKKILYSNLVNSLLSLNELDFMRDYFKQIHHEWKLKEGCGIMGIQRITDKVTGKYRAFELIRRDGSTTDISYIITNIKRPNIMNDFKKALRYIVMPQILAFKKCEFDKSPVIICPITFEETTFSNCHIDHYEPTFDEIVTEFLKENHISDLHKVLAPSMDNQTICEITDKDVSSKFYEYHKLKSNLRVLSVKANLSLLKK